MDSHCSDGSCGPFLSPKTDITQLNSTFFCCLTNRKCMEQNLNTQSSLSMNLSILFSLKAWSRWHSLLRRMCGDFLCEKSLINTMCKCFPFLPLTFAINIPLKKTLSEILLSYFCLKESAASLTAFVFLSTCLQSIPSSARKRESTVREKVACFLSHPLQSVSFVQVNSACKSKLITLMDFLQRITFHCLLYHSYKWLCC